MCISGALTGKRERRYLYHWQAVTAYRKFRVRRDPTSHRVELVPLVKQSLFRFINGTNVTKDKPQDHVDHGFHAYATLKDLKANFSRGVTGRVKMWGWVIVERSYGNRIVGYRATHMAIEVLEKRYYDSLYMSSTTQRQFNAMVKRRGFKAVKNFSNKTKQS